MKEMGYHRGRPISNQPTLTPAEEELVLSKLREIIRGIMGTGRDQRKISKRAVIAALNNVYQELFTGPQETWE